MAQIFNPTAELLIPTETQTKTQSVIVEAKVNKRST